MTAAGYLDGQENGVISATAATATDQCNQENRQHTRSISSSNTGQTHDQHNIHQYQSHGNALLHQTHKLSAQQSNFQDQDNASSVSLSQHSQDKKRKSDIFHESQQRTFSIDEDIASIRNHVTKRNDRDDHSEDYDEDDNESGDTLMAVASAEEYAAKIIKLQQACLIPLKEDLADWLNKILKTSNITTENFMDKLDNGVVICRLAKIISLWCEQQLSKSGSSRNSTDKIADPDGYERKFSPIPSFNNSNGPLRSTTSQSISCLTTSASATSLNNGLPSYRRQSRSNQFLNNLIKMHQTKIWEDAKCRTFYARDNVCNFIKWSKDFGVNQSVLFESDDLVLHANPRQVVLCLLDVARIAYVKHGFTEAPGLVKFEQEIDKELATERSYALGQRDSVLVGGKQRVDVDIHDGQPNDSSPNKKSGRARKSLDVPIDRTDELVMRYCRHKEEEAARKRNEDLELAVAAAAAATARLSSSEQALTSLTEFESSQTPSELSPGLIEPQQQSEMPKSPDAGDLNINGSNDPNQSDSVANCDIDSLSPAMDKGNECFDLDDAFTVSSTICDSKLAHKTIAETGRIDSLDSGEGPTESASTGHSSSRMPESSQVPTRGAQSHGTTSIPVPKKRTSFTPSVISQQALSMTNSELSSSRSSLFSNPDGTSSSTNQYGRPITSDLDGKVMRIAKSYYGKKATKDVTRLSEGKYKIADRIVFVRLLKGHRVMVRIGGGWDTLENFLFRHKSDPSQVIDPDNLLPLETKMPFDKSPQVTPAKSSSRLPYYRRSNSASSTNLSLSNLSVSNYSIISSTTPSNRSSERPIANSVHFSPIGRNGRQGIPQLLTHKSQTPNNKLKHNPTPQVADTKKFPQARSQSHDRQYRIPQLANNSPNLKRPFYYQQKATTPNLNHKFQQIKQRPLASSTAPTVSASNLYPVTLTTARRTPSTTTFTDTNSPVRSRAPKRDRGPDRKW